MELSLYYGDSPLAQIISVQVNPVDRKRVEEVILRSRQEITLVTDDVTYTLARRTAGELKSLHNEIYASKRAAKQPFESVLNAIEDAAKEVMTPVDKEQERVINAMTGYVRELEQKAKEQERLHKAKLAEQERLHQAEMQKLQREREQARAKAQAAQSELERRTAEQEAAVALAKASQAQTLRELDLELDAMAQEPKKGVVPEGRVAHPWKFKLKSALATLQAGCNRLLRIEVDNLACQDAVRSQLSIDPDCTPTLPGIEVTQDISVSVKASSRIK